MSLQDWVKDHEMDEEISQVGISVQDGTIGHQET